MVKMMVASKTFRVDLCHKTAVMKSGSKKSDAKKRYKTTIDREHQVEELQSDVLRFSASN